LRPALTELVQRIVVFDIQQKKSATARLRGALTDDDDLQVFIVESILRYYCERPCLSQSCANDILRNLIHLYRNLEDHIFSVDTATLFANCVSVLAQHNNAAVRSAMSSCELFDLRDNISLQLLAGLEDKEDVKEFIRAFGFEQVADQPKFRENNGLLLFLHLFHSHADDRHFQLELGSILVNIFMPIEENRKVIGKLIEDTEVLRRIHAIPIRYRYKNLVHDGKLN
jgi:hypothetical protein